ncbi:MAG: efflux RND transporter periplasmic adaptor subunit, partial [Bacteroidota bacterium]
MKKKNRRIGWYIAGSALLLVVLSRLISGENDELVITAEPVKRRSITETVSASGRIQAAAEVKIQSEVSGQILELPVKEGDFVEKGQLLVRINPDIYNSALSRAEAALNSAKSSLASSRARLVQAEAQLNVQQLNYDRMKKLFAEKAISASEMDNATSTWETARAEAVAARENIKAAEYSIESAEATRNEAGDNLRRTTITAPMSGTV